MSEPIRTPGILYRASRLYRQKPDLGNVNINSSIDQIGWRGFAGKQVGDPLVSFTDINDTYASLVYAYQMAEEADGATNYYNVEEYYKVRYTDQQIYLLGLSAKHGADHRYGICERERQYLIGRRDQ